MDTLGQIYRNIADYYGNDVSVVYLDPRNHLSIAGYLIKQCRHGKIGITELAKSLLFGIRRMAVFYNGKWINSDQETSADLILARIKELHEMR